MTDLEQQMIRALAAIDEELGMPEDGCNSTEATITAIKLLHAVHEDDQRHAERLELLLTEARDLFVMYAESHRARGPKHAEKAACNEAMAAKINAALN
jgi:hypothetical protein